MERALEWLDGLATDPTARRRGPRAPCACSAARSRSGSTPTCRGYILHLENIGILSAVQREIVIDRLMALEADEIDIEQVKWVVLMVLFSHPGRNRPMPAWKIWSSRSAGCALH